MSSEHLCPFQAPSEPLLLALYIPHSHCLSQEDQAVECSGMSLICCSISFYFCSQRNCITLPLRCGISEGKTMAPWLTWDIYIYIYGDPFTVRKILSLPLTVASLYRTLLQASLLPVTKCQGSFCSFCQFPHS